MKPLLPLAPENPAPALPFDVWNEPALPLAFEPCCASAQLLPLLTTVLPHELY
jgi:hypothetical protein